MPAATAGLIPLMRSARPLSFRVSASSDLRPVLTITPALSVPFPAAMASWTSPRCRHWSAWVPAFTHAALDAEDVAVPRRVEVHAAAAAYAAIPAAVKGFRDVGGSRFQVIAFKLAAGADVQRRAGIAIVETPTDTVLPSGIAKSSIT